jgi:endonuclease YncB( thermonuclease family)
MILSKWISAAIVMLAALAPCSAAMAGDIAGRASVIDGDTIEIHGERIRLSGIDAIESRQRCAREDRIWACGKASAFALADLIGQTTVQCRSDGRDRYGRLLAVCFKGAEDINRWMVSQGWAVAYRRYSLAYAEAETEARANRRGIWAGSFEMPWDWRRRTRLTGSGS